MRILEIGCGPGVAARAILHRWPNVYVLGIDRSPSAIRQALAGSTVDIGRQLLDFRLARAEEFVLRPDEAPFDLAFALRVGAFDGRHPEIQAQALACLASALKKGAPFYIDGGAPLRRVPLFAA
jgi:trans-aconitate methyltransferase